MKLDVKETAAEYEEALVSGRFTGHDWKVHNLSKGSDNL